MRRIANLAQRSFRLEWMREHIAHLFYGDHLSGLGIDCRAAVHRQFFSGTAVCLLRLLNTIRRRSSPDPASFARHSEGRNQSSPPDLCKHDLAQGALSTSVVMVYEKKRIPAGSADIFLTVPHDVECCCGIEAEAEFSKFPVRLSFLCGLPGLFSVRSHNRPSPLTSIFLAGGESLDARVNFSSTVHFQRHNMPLLALGHKMALSLLTLMLGRCTRHKATRHQEGCHRNDPLPRIRSGPQRRTSACRLCGCEVDQTWNRVRHPQEQVFWCVGRN